MNTYPIGDQNSPKALVVKFEGLDGCGKNTLRDAVYSKIAGNLQVLKTSEFGSKEDVSTDDIAPGHSVSSLLKKIALDERYGVDDVERQMMLSVISRRNNRVVIGENIDKYDVILVDRSFYTNYAYGVSLSDQFRPIYDVAAGSVIICDLLFWIDTSPQICQQRIASRVADEVERKGVEYQKLVHRQFESMLSSQSKVHRLDGTLAVPDLVDIVVAKIHECIQGKKR